MVGRNVGRFRITAKLGEGGMGSVWKAEDPLLARPVAIKILPRDLVDSDADRRRFLRGAKAASTLDHPGIATVFEAGEDAGELYLVTECVEGETVAERLTRGPLEVREALSLAAEVAEALDHAHGHGVIHRDVSSRNIMLTTAGKAVLIDFGLALQDQGTTTSGDIKGTVAYLAPEVVLGNSPGTRSDLYGLGVVLYEMLTGSVPFLGDTAAAMLYAAAHNKPVPPSERRAGIDEDMDRVVLQALARDAARRHASGAELAADLRKLLGPAATRSTRRRHATTGSARRGVRHGLLVLPFRDLAGPDASGQAELLGRGLAETLGSAIAREPRFQVVPLSQLGTRSQDDPSALGRSLGAAWVITGTVRIAEPRVRVSYSLLDARKGTQLGGDSLDGTLEDLFALEDAVLASVIRLLQVEPGLAAPRNPKLTAAAAHEQYLKALGYLQRSDNEASVDGGIQLLENLVATEGNSSVVHAALGRAYLRKAELSMDATWRKKAEESCRLALSLDPHSPDVLVTLGRLQHQSGQHEEAVESIRKSLDLRSDNPDAFLTLSRTYESQGRFEEAEAAAKQMIALRPEYWLGYHRLGMLLFRQGRYREAESPWRRVVELSPDNATCHFNLGANLFQLGKSAEAVAAYNRSVEILPTPGALIGLGAIHFFEGRRDEAISTLERATALSPNDPRAWGNLADVLRWMPGMADRSIGSFDRAISLAQLSLKTNPNDAEILSRLAKWLAKRDRHSAALDALQRALSIAPDNATCMAHAVTVFELAGDRVRSLEYFQKALRAGYGHIELERDPELSDLRTEPRAQSALREEMRNAVERDEPQEEDPDATYPKDRQRQSNGR